MVEPPAVLIATPGQQGAQPRQRILRLGPPTTSGGIARMCQVINWDVDGPQSWFDVVVCTDTGGSCLRLRGELDLVTAPGLERLLDQLRRDGHRRIILDLSGLELLCAAGLSVFLRADRALRAVGGRLLLLRPTRMARRVLEITGLDAALSIEPVQRDGVVVVAHLDSGEAQLRPPQRRLPQTVTRRPTG